MSSTKNPYDSPATVSHADDSRRPMGVAIPSFPTGIVGIVLIAAFVVLVVEWQGTSDIGVDHHMPPALFWLWGIVSPLLTLVTSVGMWRGTKWGWWFACFGFLSFVIQNIGNAVVANLSHGPPSFDTFASLDSLKF